MNRFASAIINSLSANIAILDDNGVILAVNSAWYAFAEENEAQSSNGFVGTNYLTSCRIARRSSADPADRDTAARFLEEWRSLQKGDHDEFSIEYPCHAPDAQRWFRVTVTRLVWEDKNLPCYIVSHANITEQWVAQEELRRLSLVAKHTTNGVVITDRDGGVEWINEGYFRLTGYTLSELKGKKPGALLQGPDTDPATVSLIRQRLASGQGIHTELLNYNKEGASYSVAMEITPIYNDAGELSHFIAIEWDITESRKTLSALAESEERFRSALLSLQEGLIIFDKTGAIRLCNQAVLQILELTESEAMGYNPQEAQWHVIHENGVPWPADTHPISISLREGRACNNQIMGVYAPGGLKWLHVNSSPIFLVGESEPSGAVVTLLDITKSKQAEAERAERARRDHRIAQVLQQAVVPVLPDRIAPGIAAHSHYQPVSDEAAVGGDFYDVFPLAQGVVGLVVGDVMGHGLAAAISISKVRFALHSFLSEHSFSDPTESIHSLNRFLFQSSQLYRRREDHSETELPCTFVALTLAIIDPPTGKAWIVTAGMDPPVLLRADSEGANTIDVGGIMLGVDPQAVYEATEITLAPGDLLAITTDGLTEQLPRRGGPPLGIERFGQLLRDAATQYGAPDAENLNGISAKAVASTRDFVGGRFRDDVCLFLVLREQSNCENA